MQVQHVKTYMFFSCLFALILILKCKIAFKRFLKGFLKLFKQPETVDKVSPTDSLGALTFFW